VTTINAIVSAYYCEEWLDNRIRNLLEQTRPVTPVIVCQYHSKEQMIAARYKECNVYLTHDIPTVYDAWNKALEFESDYVIIANSDDLMANFAIDKMAAILDLNPQIGLVYADSVIVKEQHGSPVSYLDLRDPDSDLYDGCYIGHFPMYRASLHKEHGFYDERFVVAGDYEFWLRLQRADVMFHHIKERIGEFWDRGDNLEFQKADRMVWEQAKIKRLYGRLR
jgi:hypothetical protein